MHCYDLRRPQFILASFETMCMTQLSVRTQSEPYQRVRGHLDVARNHWYKRFASRCAAQQAAHYDALAMCGVEGYV
jgi:hypothetical protein